MNFMNLGNIHELVTAETSSGSLAFYPTRNIVTPEKLFKLQSVVTDS